MLEHRCVDDDACRVSVGKQSKTVPIKMVGTTASRSRSVPCAFTFWMDNSDLHVDVQGPSGSFSSISGLSAAHVTPGWKCRIHVPPVMRIVQWTRTSCPTSFQGRALARSFYDEVVGPIVGAAPHAAALLGYGSDVLGFDTERSTDHGWGPRLQVLADDHDPADIDALRRALHEQLPESTAGGRSGSVGTTRRCSTTSRS